jgi:hypothetical protein
MTDKEKDNEIKALLKAAIARHKDTELRRDLWPQMLRKFDEQPATGDSGVMNEVPWFDWALATILSALLIVFPGAIPALLYHL